MDQSTKNNLFKKPRKIKKDLERVIKPNDYKSNINFYSQETGEKNSSVLFDPLPLTPSPKKVDALCRGSDYGGDKCSNSGFRKFFGQWIRSRGQPPKYISLAGETLNGFAAYKKCLEDKENRRKRALAEAKMAIFGDPNSESEFSASGNQVDFETRSRFSFYGVPDEICDVYRKKGIEKLYPWQVECLSNVQVLNGKNLVYSAPTSGGKTIVAEILMIRRIMLDKKKCLFVLPFISLVEEKSRDLTKKLNPLGYVVRSLHSSSSIADISEVDVVVCTIEKANLLTNKMLEDGTIQSDFGVVVIDELHMIGEEKRGYILELLITKLLTASKNQQIIAMSATLPNINDLAKWLRADLYVTDFRPVSLAEYIKVGNNLYNKQGKLVKTYKSGSTTDVDNIFELCQEVTVKDKSVLIFCPTKRWCKKCALMLSESSKATTQGEIQNNKKRESRQIVLEKLRQLPGETCEVLIKSIPMGIAYHNAGMTLEEREIIENAFRDRIIDILAATSTLAAGVNLPAYRVIFRDPYVGLNFLCTTKYKQMSGRAGRAGIDEYGESILICNKSVKLRCYSLMRQKLSAVKSCLTLKDQGLSRIILEAISSKVAKTILEVNLFVRSTLMFVQSDQEATSIAMQKAMSFLLDNRFVEKTPSPYAKKSTLQPVEGDNFILNTPSLLLNRDQRKRKKLLLEHSWTEKKLKNSEIYLPTQFGNAAFYSGLNPEEAIFIKNEITRARKNLVLKGSLHLCYLVTPVYYVSVEPNWTFYFQTFGSLSPVFRETALNIGIDESYLSQCSFRFPPHQSRDLKTVVHRRFFLALLLFEIVNEKSVSEVASHYGVERGQLQSLQNSASSFASMVALFCQRLNWTAMAGLICHFSERINFGVQGELVPLLQIPGVKAFRARALYDSGFRSVQEVASGSPKDIAKAISKYNSFSLRKKADPDRVYREKVEAQTARKIVKKAKAIMRKQLEEIDVML